MTSVQIGEPHDEIEQWFTIVETVVLSIAMLFGVFGNLLTVTIVSISKQIRTVPNVYVASLSIANLFLSGLAAPYFVITLWTNRNTMNGPRGCEAMAYLTFVLLTITLYNQAAISVNRYVIVTKPKKIYIQLYKSWKVYFSLVLIWLIPALLFTVPYYGLSTYGFNTHREMCLFEEDNDEKIYWYLLASDIVGPVLILMVTIICYLRIMQHFRNSRRRINQKSGGTIEDNSAGGSSNAGTYNYPYMGSTGQLSIPNWNTVGSSNPSAYLVTRQRKQKQHTKSILKNLVLPWLILLLLRLPLVIVHIIDHNDKLPAAYNHIGLSLVFFNPSFDFIIYALLNRQMRQHLKAIFNCRSPNTARYIPH